MSFTPAAAIAWIDVETTGLDPAADALLEIAVVVGDAQDNPVDQGVSVVICPGELLDVDPGEAAAVLKGRMAPMVAEMHEESGLLDAIRGGEAVSPEEGDRLVVEYLESHGLARTMILGGNSITLDRNFLEANAPRTFAHLHYHSHDCTSVTHFLRRGARAEGLDWSVPNVGTAHRGMSDLLTSMAQSRRMRELVESGELVDPVMVARRVLAEPVAVGRGLLKVLAERLRPA